MELQRQGEEALKEKQEEQERLRKEREEKENLEGDLGEMINMFKTSKNGDSQNVQLAINDPTEPSDEIVLEEASDET
jgi:hypothetical protein